MAIQQISFINNTLSKIRSQVLSALGYTPENVANKTTDLSGTSDIKYPTQNAVKSALDSLETAIGIEIDALDAAIQTKQDKLFYDIDLGCFLIPGDEYES